MQSLYNFFLFFDGAGYSYVQLVKLLLLDRGGCAHHDILRVLVHREQDDLADGVPRRQAA